MSKANDLSPTEQFFYKHAGYSFDPQTETQEQGRRRCAREMAAVEAHALSMGWRYDWEWDPAPWDGDAPEPHEVLGCTLRNAAGQVLASLWGIGDPSPAYARVVQAELAAEAREEITAAVLEAI